MLSIDFTLHMTLHCIFCLNFSYQFFFFFLQRHETFMSTKVTFNLCKDIKHESQMLITASAGIVYTRPPSCLPIALYYTGQIFFFSVILNSQYISCLFEHSFFVTYVSAFKQLSFFLISLLE